MSCPNCEKILKPGDMIVTINNRCPKCGKNIQLIFGGYVSYNYKEQRERLFTEKGQSDVINMLQTFQKLTEKSGAAMMCHLISASNVSVDSWYEMACVDRLVELGIAQEVTSTSYAGQHRVFIRTLRSA